MAFAKEYAKKSSEYVVCPPVSSWKACAKISLDDLASQNPLVSILGLLLLVFLDPLVEERGLLLLVFLGLFGLGLPLLLHTLDALLNVHHQAWARLLGCQEKTKAQGYKDRLMTNCSLSNRIVS